MNLDVQSPLFFWGGAVLLAVWARTLVFFFLADDKRTVGQCVGDIRQTNVYNSYFLSATVVFFGLALRQNVSLPKDAVTYLILALAAASLGLLFLPIRRTSTDDTVEASAGTRVYWLTKVVASQLTLILTLMGVTDAVATTYLGLSL